MTTVARDEDTYEKPIHTLKVWGALLLTLYVLKCVVSKSLKIQFLYQKMLALRRLNVDYILRNSHNLFWELYWTDNKLNSWCDICLQNPEVDQVFKNFSASYRNRSFFKAFTRARNWPVFCTKLTQSLISYPICFMSILYTMWKSRVKDSGFPKY